MANTSVWPETARKDRTMNKFLNIAEQILSTSDWRRFIDKHVATLLLDLDESGELAEDGWELARGSVDGFVFDVHDLLTSMKKLGIPHRQRVECVASAIALFSDSLESAVIDLSECDE
jgi:hypothetical protein